METEYQQQIIFEDDFKEEMLTIRFSKGREAPKDTDVGATLGGMISRTCLVGKVYSDRIFTAGLVKSGLERAWTLKGEFRVTEKGNNVFIIGCELEDDCDKIMRGVPWLMSNMHMNFKRWFPNMSIKQIPFRLSTFWIQLHDLPLEFLDEYKIRKICNVFSAMTEIDERIESIMGWNGFVRVRIEFLPEKPLMPGIFIYIDEGQRHWIKI
ncbi:hypothetical protein Tsubulata_039284 [Turnera subulata]|uniref:DUF4283 domain-containing protein n=1 Tax=Turnera subulata TaxID=218843 RepID=A0A9Q0GGH4_9ROSI|nr:hypothetical protein Tsubulata_039284 [Turnera subulata]